MVLKFDVSRVSHHNFFHFILWCVSTSSSGPDLPLSPFLFCAFFYLLSTDSPKPFSKSKLNLSYSKKTTWHSTSKKAWFCKVPCCNGKIKIKTNKNYSSFQLIQYSRKKKPPTNFFLGSYESYILGLQFFNILGN